MQHPPSYVLVENVVGFDQSPMRAQLRDVLASIGLCMQVRPDEALKQARRILVPAASPEPADVRLQSGYLIGSPSVVDRKDHPVCMGALQPECVCVLASKSGTKLCV